MKRALICIALLPATANAQLNIGTTGGDYSNAEGSIAFTIGQTMTDFIELQEQAINEGVQQPYEYFSLAATHIDELLLIEFFPNPTSGIIHLKGDALNGATIQLVDANGRLIMDQILEATTSTLDLSLLPTGVYTLQVLQNSLSNSLRIIKH